MPVTPSAMRATHAAGFLAALGMTAIFALACGKHDAAPNTPPASAPDPCSLVSTDDLKQITGTPFRDGATSGDGKTVSACVWQEGGEAAAGSVKAAIHTADIEALLGQLRNVYGNEKLDLGEESYWSNALNQLTVRTGPRVVTVTFNTSGGGADHKAAAIEIAKKIIAQL